MHPEVRNRLRKALALADTLSTVGEAGWDDPEIVKAEFRAHQWALVADAAGVNIPSTETQAWVVEILAYRKEHK